ncbi:hypothetical protein CP533_5089 [Ophiocordyceps camponoti-saundersi (nom. inval.)]|nr:hypothetical protein CP533_5089 [Ophiocordyceps camponoti-saundersi (nom. inval.)]
MVGGKSILHLNSLPHPVNTLDQHSTAGSSSDAPPAKRQKVTPTPSTSPYFSKPGHGDAHFSDPSTPQHLFRSKSSVGATSPHHPEIGLLPPKFKSSAGKKRTRRSRNDKQRSQVISPSSDDLTSASGSSDILAQHPPPANVVSDVQPPSGSGGLTMTSYKLPQPTRGAEQAPKAEDKLNSNHIKVLESDDELNFDPMKVPKSEALPNSESTEKRQTNFSKIVDKDRQSASRGDILRTRFGKPRQLKHPLPQEHVVIGVKRAVGGRIIYDSGQGQPPVLLQLQEIQKFTGHKLVFALAQSEKTLKWLEIDIETIKNVKHSERCLVIERPVAKLFIELDTVKDCKKLLKLIPVEKVINKEHEDVDSIFERNFQETKVWAKSRRQASEPKQLHETKDHGMPWSASKFEPNPKPVARSARLKDNMQSGVSRTADKGAIDHSSKPEVVPSANTATRLRQTRNLLSTTTAPVATATSVSPTPKRWTRQNPAWRECWDRSLMYPATGKNRTTVDDEDIPRLDEGEFLNDNLISFYLRYLEINLEKEQPGLREKVYIFSTFFFEKLRSTRSHINYDGVKTWTAKFDLFSYDYIIVPVNENAHWYLAIICNVPNAINGIPGQGDVEVIELPEEPVASSVTSTCTTTVTAKPSDETALKSNLQQLRIIILDSLGALHGRTTKALKDYLVEEAKYKKNIDLALPLKGINAKDIPMQNNYCDCGLFVLGYVEEFLKDPDGNARKLLEKENPGWEMQPGKLRTKIRGLLFELQKDQKDRLIKEKATKQKSSSGTKASKGNKQLATDSAAASASSHVDTSSHTETGIGPGVQQTTLTLMQRSGSESLPFAAADDPAPKDKVAGVEALSDSGNSTNTEKASHRTPRTSPGGLPQKEGADVAATSSVDTDAVRGKERSTLHQQPPFVRPLSSSSPTTVRSDDAVRLVPAVETISDVTSPRRKVEGSKVTLSVPAVRALRRRAAEAHSSTGSRAGYGGIDRTVDLMDLT